MAKDRTAEQFKKFKGTCVCLSLALVHLALCAAARPALPQRWLPAALSVAEPACAWWLLELPWSPRQPPHSCREALVSRCGCLRSAVPFFNAIPPERYYELANLCEIQKYDADTVIFREGALFCLRSCALFCALFCSVFCSVCCAGSLCCAAPLLSRAD